MCGCILFTNIKQMLHTTTNKTNKTQIIGAIYMSNKRSSYVYPNNRSSKPPTQFIHVSIKKHRRKDHALLNTVYNTKASGRNLYHTTGQTFSGVSAFPNTCNGMPYM